MSTKDLRSQISTLTSELELSAFLNKGVLQSNSEYKLRIAELERENTVLRIAESRLAKTEDRLEEAEKRLKEHDIEWEQAEKEWAEEVDREIELRRSLEGERDAWKRRFERFWEGLEGVMGESKREVEKSRREARKSGSMSKRKSNVIVPIQESSPVPPASVIRKRRRVQDTPEESVVEKTPPPPPSPQPRRRSPPRTRPSASKRDSGPSSSARKVDKETPITRRVEIETVRRHSPTPTKIKIEDPSPPKAKRRAISVDSGDDPLAF